VTDDFSYYRLEWTLFSDYRVCRQNISLSSKFDKKSLVLDFSGIQICIVRLSTMRCSRSRGANRSRRATVTKGKNGNKIRDDKYYFFAVTKNFAAATKRFNDRTKHFVVTKYFCYPYFNKRFCWYNKTFYSVTLPILVNP